MPASICSPHDIATLLERWLTARLEPAALAWLDEKLQAVAAGDKKTLFLSFGLTARKVGKNDLKLNSDDLAAASTLRPGWNPRFWTVDQAARVLFVLKFPATEAEPFVAVLDQLFAAGEVHELVALYQGLPLYPHQSALQLRCAEGQRTNIPAVFKAIAHHNPFPSEQLNEDQWNQLVLKCLFIGIALDPIFGIDDRANARLAKMLTDFAHERWAAKRQVSPELWRCVGPFADDAMLNDLEHVLKTGTEPERQAATLALESCPAPRAAQLINTSGLNPYHLSWSIIAAAST
ncbi:hypothetical protein GC163_09170 [bacterium]|nr:hypothetical protein [bacterium]